MTMLRQQCACCLLVCCAPAEAMRAAGGASSRMRERVLSRRECGFLGALSALASTPTIVGAYDNIKDIKPDFAELEKKRLAREATKTKEKKTPKPKRAAPKATADKKQSRRT